MGLSKAITKERVKGMFYIVLCEDEVLQREILTNYLKEIFKNLGLDYSILEFSSGEELLYNYPDRVDILFLDIQLGKLTGMDIAKKIRAFDKNVEIIFTTGTFDYIYDGYEVRAYRYLLKPLKYECILKHTESCINELIERKDTIVIKDRNKTFIMRINDILYVEVIRKEIIIYTKEEKSLFKVSMKSIEESLVKKNFFRCHKSYLINLKKVESLIEKENIVVIDDYKIPVSRYKIKDLKIEIANILGDVLC